ncbi:hypothetical protein [Enterococcus hirae]|uniref:hypothetical protein n=1 Tax=Enterococcus hirae TaxID=1354 RepID=UPI00136AF285|nr:hypothetical protein [Enterococcus hirae]
MAELRDLITRADWLAVTSWDGTTTRVDRLDDPYAVELAVYQAECARISETNRTRDTFSLSVRYPDPPTRRVPITADPTLLAPTPWCRHPNRPGPLATAAGLTWWAADRAWLTIRDVLDAALSFLTGE